MKAFSSTLSPLGFFAVLKKYWSGQSEIDTPRIEEDAPSAEAADIAAVNQSQALVEDLCFLWQTATSPKPEHPARASDFRGKRIDIEDIQDLYFLMLSCDPLTKDLEELSITELVTLVGELPYATPDLILEACFIIKVDQNDMLIQNLIKRALKDKAVTLNALERPLTHRSFWFIRSWILKCAAASDAASVSKAANFLSQVGKDKVGSTPVDFSFLSELVKEEDEVLEIYTCLFRDKLKAEGVVALGTAEGLLASAKALAS